MIATISIYIISITIISITMISITIIIIIMITSISNSVGSRTSLTSSRLEAASRPLVGSSKTFARRYTILD